MALCSNCGREMGTGVYCGGCGQRTGGTPQSSSSPVVHNAHSAPTSTVPSPTSTSGGGSSGVGITLMVLGTLGALSPFLTWIEDYDEAYNGWDTAEALSFLGRFSQGPVAALIAGAVTAVMGIVVFNASKNGKRLSKGGIGGGTLGCGAVTALSAGATYNALDEVLQESGEFAAQGIGLSLAGLSGVVIFVLGIVLLNKGSLTGNP